MPTTRRPSSYDDRDLLLQAQGPYGTQSYTYDALGNVLTKAGVTFTYGATAQTCGRLMPHAVTATSDGKTYTYDCNGNLLTDGTRSFAWDADNKPVSILQGGSATTFAYSGDGVRVKKVGGRPDHPLRGGLRGPRDRRGPGEARLRRGPPGGHPGGRAASTPGIYFVHGDHLGSLNVLTNSSGTEVQRLTYKPYGETFTNTGSVDFHQYRSPTRSRTRRRDCTSTRPATIIPSWGGSSRRIPSSPNPATPRASTGNSYVTNNPATLVDPSGHGIWDQTAEWAEQPASTLVISQTIMDLWSLPPVTIPGPVLGVDRCQRELEL